MRKLYEAPGNWIYEAKTRVRNVRYGKHVCSNKEQIGWDMLRLIERFENHPKLSGINTFKIWCGYSTSNAKLMTQRVYDSRIFFIWRRIAWYLPSLVAV